MAPPASIARGEALDNVTEAYELFAPELRRYATARLRDATAAEDIVQEAFIRLAIESRGQHEPALPRAWLRRVVLNLIISRSRRAEVARRRAAQVAVADVVHESPEIQFLAAERHRTLGTAMGSVAPESRACLLLAAQGYSGREIAVALGRTEGATRTLMCRARREIRRELTSRDPAFAAA
jgi:RNA polymerase sigma-70 factor (ECF subfamily)